MRGLGSLGGGMDGRRFAEEWYAQGGKSSDLLLDVLTNMLQRIDKLETLLEQHLTSDPPIIVSDGKGGWLKKEWDGQLTPVVVEE